LTGIKIGLELAFSSVFSVPPDLRDLRPKNLVAIDEMRNPKVLTPGLFVSGGRSPRDRSGEMQNVELDSQL
jgi:hypothetical protein